MKFKLYLLEKKSWEEEWEKIEHYIIHMSEEEMPGVKTRKISYKNGVITVIVDRNDGIYETGYCTDLSEKLWNRVKRHDDQILPPVIRVDVFNEPIDDETLIHPIKKWSDKIEESTHAEFVRKKQSTKGAFHPGQIDETGKQFLEYNEPFNVFQFEKGDLIYFNFIKVDSEDRIEYRYSPSLGVLFKLRGFTSAADKIANVKSFDEAITIAKYKEK